VWTDHEVSIGCAGEGRGEFVLEESVSESTNANRAIALLGELEGEGADEDEEDEEEDFRDFLAGSDLFDFLPAFGLDEDEEEEDEDEEGDPFCLPSRAFRISLRISLIESRP